LSKRLKAISRSIERNKASDADVRKKINQIIDKKTGKRHNFVDGHRVSPKQANAELEKLNRQGQSLRQQLLGLLDQRKMLTEITAPAIGAAAFRKVARKHALAGKKRREQGRRFKQAQRHILASPKRGMITDIGLNPDRTSDVQILDLLAVNFAAV
jgi:hypothetical protein